MRPCSVSVGSKRHVHAQQHIVTLTATGHRPCILCRGDLSDSSDDVPHLGMLPLYKKRGCLDSYDERTAGSASQQVSPATRGRSKDLQPPYNVVITGGTKGTPSLSFLCHKDCLTSLCLSSRYISLVLAHKMLTWLCRRWEGASDRVSESRGFSSHLLKKRCALI